MLPSHQRQRRMTSASEKSGGSTLTINPVDLSPATVWGEFSKSQGKFEVGELISGSH